MRFKEFLNKVQENDHINTDDEALNAVRATLQILGQRITEGEATDLAAQLPEEMKGYLTDQAADVESFDVDEFFSRVSKVEDIPVTEAKHHARAVMAVIKEAVTKGEIDDIHSQLPEDYDHLFIHEEEEAIPLEG